LVDPWYGTEYSCFKAGADLMAKLRRAEQETLACFQLPAKNAFVPEKFELYSLESEKGKAPEVVAEDSFHRLWFKQDDEYLMPKSCVYLHFRNPLVYVSPLNCALSTMYAVKFYN